MILKIENNLLLQKYKLAYEERESVKKIYEEGNRDLNAHLILFQEKLSNSVKNQKERFDNFFFSQKEEKDSEEIKNYSDKPGWAKKLYRSIALVTHPDKTGFIPVESVREKFGKYYQIAIDSYEDEEYENLLFIGNDLGIEPEDKSVYDIIEPKLKITLEEIERIKRTNAFQWAGIAKDKKVETLETYLKNMGFVFTRERVEEVVEEVKKNKRKVGTRPVNYIKKRLKS